MTAQTATLTDFLLARTTERADVAREWLRVKGDDLAAWSVAGYTTSRCEALVRAIDAGRLDEDALLQQARRYADHPDFREEWRA